MAVEKMVSVKKPAPTPKLFDRIGTYFDGRHANGREGLVLLDECIRRTASKDRDWDALARFMTRAGLSSSAPKVKKIIRAAFGNSITFVTDKKHPAGGRFSLSWEGAFPLAQSNTYSAIKKAVADNKSWDDKDFLAALSKIIPDLPKKDKVVSATAQTAAAKHVAKYLAERAAEGFSIGDIVKEAQALLVANAKPSAGLVAKSVVNGVTVYEPSF